MSCLSTKTRKIHRNFFLKKKRISFILKNKYEKVNKTKDMEGNFKPQKINNRRMKVPRKQWYKDTEELKKDFFFFFDSNLYLLRDFLCKRPSLTYPGALGADRNWSAPKKRYWGATVADWQMEKSFQVQRLVFILSAISNSQSLRNRGPHLISSSSLSFFLSFLFFFYFGEVYIFLRRGTALRYLFRNVKTLFSSLGN